MTVRSQKNSRLESFRYAFRGITLMLKTETNARIHAGATLVVVLVGFAFDITRTEWLALTLTISAVWSLEALNTAFEAICDVASSEYHPQVERAKDVAAGAVLIAALAAVVVGMLVFAPRFAALLG